MPNHVKNVWRIKNLNKTEIDQIVNSFTEESGLPRPTGSYGVIDFDKIIPEPRKKEDCPEDCLMNRDHPAEKLKDREWFNWYEWHLKYWNTKWNAYDGYTLVGSNSVTFVFSTAWSLAAPIIAKLTLLNHDMDIRYADEDWGNNCGRLSYDASTCKWYRYKHKDPKRFAKNLWDKY